VARGAIDAALIRRFERGPADRIADREPGRRLAQHGLQLASSQ